MVNGGGEGQQFFSDGLFEALIIALSQFDGLKVIGLGLSMTMEAKAIPGAMFDISPQLDCNGRV